MNIEEFGFALLLSLPVGFGVTAAIMVSTDAQTPLLAAGSGFVVTVAVFALVVVGVAYESEGKSLPARIAENVTPDPNESTPGDLWLGAGMGACVTVLLWYIPMSPVLGGAAAGALQGGDQSDARMAGFLAGAFVPIVVFLFGVMAFVLAGAEVFGRFPFGVQAASAAAVAGVAYSLIFSTVGGHIAGFFVDQERAWGEPEARER